MSSSSGILFISCRTFSSWALFQTAMSNYVIWRSPGLSWPGKRFENCWAPPTMSVRISIANCIILEKNINLIDIFPISPGNSSLRAHHLIGRHLVSYPYANNRSYYAQCNQIHNWQVCRSDGVRFADGFHTFRRRYRSRDFPKHLSRAAGFPWRAFRGHFASGGGLYSQNSNERAQVVVCVVK